MWHHTASHTLGGVMDGFGSTLRRHRTAAGLGLRGLAKQVHVDYSHLARVERGECRPTADLAQRCDTALNAAGALIDAYHREQASPDMHRRTILGAMGALAVAPVGPLIGLEALRHSLDPGRKQADEWDRIVADYGRDYYTLPAADLAEQLRADLTVLAHQIGASPADRDLMRVAAHLSAIMAMGLSAAGQHGMARRWWRTARNHADQSRDADCRVWVRDWEVVNGTYEQRPTAAILDRAGEAVAIAGSRVSVGHVGVLSGRAQALAVAGRVAEARDALAATAAMTDRMPAAVAADADSMFGWPEVRLRHTESFVYTHIGDVVAAAEAQERALDLYPAELGRERAQMLMHRASCLIQGGHVGDGLRFAADVLDALPAADHTALLYQVARTVVAVVPERERRRVEAVELRDRLTALPAG
ncbi:hypothetical protein GCM10011608_10170 [Micromonospora sonchi]|uniref:HTH cro/C1-type domain-containing protein n=1 Tax=Micromonospora sonchi TaxID=1763543 RepID=A0A917TL72_9ACTN|nr:helix-turn-helix transcriptional regulator [Micromonospora sonchi]GGM27380.1 hypothetical protein GCM10011608_10170 [Micromonospora sonchi]